MIPLRSPDFAALVQGFFSDRLMNQQGVSPHTVVAYRDTFRLLLTFVADRCRRSPAELSLADFDAPTVLAFLDHLETSRGNGVRTRNARLTAIRAFVAYASAWDPTTLPLARRILAIPRKRFDRPLLGYLTRIEVEAILAAPDAADWSGRRDRALFTLMYNTGARVSEVIGVRRAELCLGPSATVQLRGKGRKDRSVPLWKTTAALLAAWMRESSAEPGSPLFPNRFGSSMSRSGIENRLARAVATAARQQPSLLEKTVSPHTLRHSTAMHLLQAGVDVTVIALWLGHENPGTTHQYVEANIEMKRRVLARLEEPPVRAAPRPKSDRVLHFLDRL